jgi:hypothetical protein
MIQVDSLLYKIDQRLNKLSTNEHQQIQPEDKILALNEAQLILIKQKVSGFSTTNGMGMDAFKKRYEDLQGMVEDYKDHPLSLEETNEQLHQWSSGLSTLNPEYFLYLDSYIIANKGRCKNRIIWINKDLLKHGDVQFLLNNVHYRPSFEYQETFNSISSNEISIFTDGTFIPTKLYLMYMRYPNYIDKEGYVKFDGSDSVNTNCELPLYMEDELLDLTILNLGFGTENISAVQSSQMRIQTNE